MPLQRHLPSGMLAGLVRHCKARGKILLSHPWPKAHYDGIVAFSQTDFTQDLKKITVPVLVMHGDDDQIVPYADSGPLSARLVQNGTLKTYHGFPHGMPTTEARNDQRSTCWPSCSPDRRRLGVGCGSTLCTRNRTGSHPRTEHADMPAMRYIAIIEGLAGGPRSRTRT